MKSTKVNPIYKKKSKNISSPGKQNWFKNGTFYTNRQTKLSDITKQQCQTTKPTTTYSNFENKTTWYKSGTMFPLWHWPKGDRQADKRHFDINESPRSLTAVDTLSVEVFPWICHRHSCIFIVTLKHYGQAQI